MASTSVHSMNHSRKLNTHRQEASKTDTVDTDAYDRKIQSLLDTNRLLARENQFLSQQSDMLRKEHDALGHLMRSRIALSNVKEMELKSALEGMRIVVQEKEKVTVSLERKYNDLLERMKSFESSGVEEKKQTNVTPASCRIRRLSRQFTDVSPGEEHAGSHAQSLEGMTEAFHPWLSPVLMRLETLEKEHGASLQGLCRTDFAPMAELQETISAPDSLQFCGLDDAISCTGDRQTTVQTLGEADDQRSPIQEEKKIEAESQYRWVFCCL